MVAFCFFFFCSCREVFSFVGIVCSGVWFGSPVTLVLRIEGAALGAGKFMEIIFGMGFGLDERFGFGGTTLVGSTFLGTILFFGLETGVTGTKGNRQGGFCIGGFCLGSTIRNGATALGIGFLGVLPTGLDSRLAADTRPEIRLGVLPILRLECLLRKGS